MRSIVPTSLAIEANNTNRKLFNPLEENLDRQPKWTSNSLYPPNNRNNLLQH